MTSEEIAGPSGQVDRLELGRDPVRPFLDEVVPVLRDVPWEGGLELPDRRKAEGPDLLLQRRELAGAQLGFELVGRLCRVLRGFDAESLHVLEEGDDALEFLATEHSLETTLRFVQWLGNQVSSTGSALLASVDPRSLELKDLSRLERAFQSVA